MISIFLILDIIGNYFFSTTIILSYIISISYLIKYKFKNYFYLILIMGLIYDLIFTDILFLNSLLLFIISLLVRKYRNFNILFLGFIGTIIYFISKYLIIILYYPVIFDYIYFIKYIIVNYVLFLLTYFITRRIYNIRWKYGRRIS